MEGKFSGSNAAGIIHNSKASEGDFDLLKNELKGCLI